MSEEPNTSKGAGDVIKDPLPDATQDVFSTPNSSEILTVYSLESFEKETVSSTLLQKPSVHIQNRSFATQTNRTALSQRKKKRRKKKKKVYSESSSVVPSLSDSEAETFIKKVNFQSSIQKARTNTEWEEPITLEEREVKSHPEYNQNNKTTEEPEVKRSVKLLSDLEKASENTLVEAMSKRENEAVVPLPSEEIKMPLKSVLKVRKANADDENLENPLSEVETTRDMPKTSIAKIFRPLKSILKLKSSPTDSKKSDQSFTKVVRNLAPLISIGKFSSNIFNKIRNNDDLHSNANFISYGNVKEFSKHTLLMGNAIILLVLPPDGGYGWIIVFLSFINQAIIDGILFGQSVMLLNLQKEYPMPNACLALLSSIQLATHFLFEPISSALVNSIGIQPVTMIGSSLAMLSILIASFCSSFPLMVFFCCFVGGIAISMIWTSSQLIIGFYFEKYRPIANGLAASGSGVGIMTFSLLNSYLENNIGFRNIWQVHVGLLLLTLLNGLVMVPVKPSKIPAYYEMFSDSDYDSEEVISVYNYSQIDIVSEDESIEEESIQQVSESKFFEIIKKFLNCACCSKPTEKPKTRKRDAHVKNFTYSQDPIERPDLYYTGKIYARRIADLREKFPAEDGTKLQILTNSKKLGAVAYHIEESHGNYIKRTSIKHKSYKALKTDGRKYPLLRFLSLKNILHAKFYRALKKLLDVSILRSMDFCILFLSSFLFLMGMTIPFIYSTVRAKCDPEYLLWITPTMGIAIFISHILMGFTVYFLGPSKTKYFCGCAMMFSGMFVTISSFYGQDSNWFQIIYAFCYGIAPAFYMSLRALLYVRVLGFEELSSAFGLTSLSMGIGVIVGSLVAGMLNDLTNDYVASFFFSGMCILLAGGLTLYEPIASMRRKKNNDDG